MATTNATDQGQFWRGIAEGGEATLRSIRDVTFPDPKTILGNVATATDTIGDLIRAATAPAGAPKTPIRTDLGTGRLSTQSTFTGPAKTWVETPPATTMGRLQRGAGAGVGGTIFGGGLAGAGEGAALTVGQMMRNLTIGAGAGAASAEAQEAAPEALKPVAGVAGAVLGGLATHGAIETPGAIARGVGGVAEPFTTAMGPAVNEGNAGALAAGNSPVARAAARQLTAAATDPAAVRASVAGGPDYIVPGSEPTSFQQSGDLGLGAAERAAATRNAVPFLAREAQQNVARTTELQSIQAGGDPNALTSGLRANFDALDARTQADLDRATNTARTAANIGGEGTPEGYGEATRTAVLQAETAEKVRMRGLYEAIDPNHDMLGNAQQTIREAGDIRSSIGQAAKPMEGEEAAIFDAAQALKPLSPLSDIMDMRSRVSAEMRRQQLPTGDPQSLRRLTMLKSAIQDNLATTIAHQIANESGAVDRGVLPLADSTAARIQAWVDEYRQQQTQARTGGGGPTEGVPAVGAPIHAGPDGTGLPPEGGLAGAPGDTGLPPNAPTIDPAALARMNAATAEYAGYKARFGAPPISSVTAGSGGLFRLPEGLVAGKFFHPGPNGFNDMQALFKAVGPEKSLPVMVDYAASSLRRAAMRTDGTLDPAKYQVWASRHADALRALPDDIRSRFANAADAAKVITAAGASRTLALKAYQAGALGRVMHLTSGQDIVRTVGNIMGSKTAVADLKGLFAEAQKAGPDAVEGLRQAVVDHVADKYIGNTEAGTTGVSALKSDAFQTFVRTNKEGLEALFPDEKVESFERLARELQRGARSQNATKIKGQSNTMQDLTAAAGGKATPAVVRNLLSGLVGTGGALAHGPIGGVAGWVGANLVLAMRETGINRVQDLVAQALLHPAVMRELLAKTTKTRRAGDGLANALRISVRAAVGTANQP
jgi:hypothetical protein